MRSISDTDVLFLQMQAEIQANPSIFFDSAQTKTYTY
jgi:hypothetical protein